MASVIKKPYESVFLKIVFIAEDVLTQSNFDNNGFDIDTWTEEIYYEG